MRKNLSYIKGITYSLWSMNLWTLQSPQQLLLGDREEHQQGVEKVLWRPDVFQQVLRRAVFKFCSTHPRAKLSRSLTCPHRCCWKSLSASCLPFLSSGLTSPSCITMSELLYLPATLPLPHSPRKIKDLLGGLQAEWWCCRCCVRTRKAAVAHNAVGNVQLEKSQTSFFMVFTHVCFICKC